MPRYTGTDLPSQEESEELLQMMSNEEKLKLQKDVAKQTVSTISPMEESEKLILQMPETKKRKFVVQCIENAKNKWYKKIKENDITLNENIVVCHMSKSDFIEYSELFPKNCYFEDDIVYMKEMISDPHQICSHYTINFLDNFFENTMVGSNGAGRFIQEKKGKESDGCFFPDVLPKRADPTVVLELGYKNEDVPKLQNELIGWLSPFTNVQIAIGVKIGNGQNDTSILFFIGYRGDPEIYEHDIGTVEYYTGRPVDISKLPDIKLPVAMLFEGKPIPTKYQRKKYLMLSLSKYSAGLLKHLAFSKSG